MKKITPTSRLLLTVAFSMFVATRLLAFDSGSDGSYGPMNITTTTTLDLPASGIFNCTTINIASGATLRFNRNPLNTPVYLLATGNVTVNGTIDVSGNQGSGAVAGPGGPGGFDGGHAGFGTGPNNIGSDGQGPGGGKNANGKWSAAFAAASGQNSNTYGNALNSPLIGGSGGAGLNSTYAGGGGGGAVLIAANTRITNNGTINSYGGSGTGFGGGGGAASGGAIRLVAPVVSGSGVLNALGGLGSGIGSAGRIRIDCLDGSAYHSLTMNGSATRGTQMFVFPAVVPRLDIVEAAGQTIAEGAGSSVQIQLPAGSSTSRTVTVQARDFTGAVPITVAVVPENRPSSDHSATITMTGNPSQTIVNVVIPDGTVSRISAWTR